MKVIKLINSTTEIALVDNEDYERESVYEITLGEEVERIEQI